MNTFQTPPAMAVSSFSVSRVGSRSQLISCRSCTPLKILNPQSAGDTCHVVLSSFGGGFVDGDRVGLEIDCGADSVLYLETQANTRVYETPGEHVALQRVTGRLQTGALAVVAADPLVPHRRSRFEQYQEWHLDAGACLVLYDWLTSGRSDNGEHHQYDCIDSEIRIHVDSRPLIIDRYRFEPGVREPSITGGFGGYHHLLNIYFVGDLLLPLSPVLSEHTSALRIVDGSKPVAAISQVRDKGFILRAMAHGREELGPLLSAVYATLAADHLLGFNPLSRKT